MNTPRKEVGVATYLLGNGPYRSPGPIDLQWMRIHQYRRLLGSKYGGAWSPVHDYTDINSPRAETNIDEQADEGRRTKDEEDQLWLMVHCGSRALGQAIRDHHLGKKHSLNHPLFVSY